MALLLQRNKLHILLFPVEEQFSPVNPSWSFFPSMSQESSHSPAIPCDITRSWCLCHQRLFIWKVSSSGLHSCCIPTGTKHNYTLVMLSSY